MFKERVFHLVSSGLDIEVLCAKTVERNNAENLKYLIPGQKIQFNSVQLFYLFCAVRSFPNYLERQQSRKEQNTTNFVTVLPETSVPFVVFSFLP